MIDRDYDYDNDYDYNNGILNGKAVTSRRRAVLGAGVILLTAVFSFGETASSREDPHAVHWPGRVEINFAEVRNPGSPYVFGATQPRGLSDRQWDRLKEDGFNFARSQADLTRLVPVDSPEEYRANRNGVAEPENWDWEDGVYGDDFVQRAMDRGFQVCLTIKNARWNRYPGAPDDEETMPRDLEMWGDIITKIINHYQGGVTYVEMFNEVDRAPQFRVEGSPFTREKGYREAVWTALQAVESSNYPDTPVGGPAAALVGAEEAEWLLKDARIRDRLGCLTFHEFDCPVYPRWAPKELRAVAAKYGRGGIPLVRSSYVPEFERNLGRPGTMVPVYVAPMIIGALKDGLAATSMWEIQNRGGEEDPRYWFDDGETVQTAQLYRLMSRALKLGDAESRVVASTGPFAHVLGAINHAGEKVAVFAAPKACSFKARFTGFAGDEEKTARLYRADDGFQGLEIWKTLKKTPEDGAVEWTVNLPDRGVLGVRFE